MSIVGVREPDFADVIARTSRALASSDPGATVESLATITGGSSGFTYTATVTRPDGSSHQVVVKVAPPGLDPVRNRDVLRQARMMRYVSGAIPVPRVLGAEHGDPPQTPPLFVMELAPGEAFEPQVTVGSTVPDTSVLAARMRAAVELLADLQRVPVDGVDEHSEHAHGPDHELARWTRAFAAVDLDLRFDEATVRRRLTARVPTAVDPVVVHGDWRLGNMLASGHTINAVVDWETWSIGDPRIDLAWLLMFGTSGHPHGVRDIDALPDTTELIRRYEARSGGVVGSLDWFAALVRYKQAAASALIVKNHRRLARPEIDIDLIHRSIPILLETAADLFR